jgi:hypothetical protein
MDRDHDLAIPEGRSRSSAANWAIPTVSAG